MKSILLLSVLIGIALAAKANPPTPTWPNAFASSVLMQDNQGDMPRFSRWFYDYTNQFERFDGMRQFNGEMYFHKVIVDWTKQIEYRIIFHDDSVTCFTNSTHGQMMHPQFANFQYIGPAMIFYDVCNWWAEENQQKGYLMQLWNDATTQEFRRFDFNDYANQFEVTFTFMEMDVGAQDANLWVIDPIIQSICFSA